METAVECQLNTLIIGDHTGIEPHLGSTLDDDDLGPIGDLGDHFQKL